MTDGGSRAGSLLAGWRPDRCTLLLLVKASGGAGAEGITRTERAGKG